MAEFDFGIENLDQITEDFLNASDIGTGIGANPKDIKKIDEPEDKPDSNNPDPLAKPSNEDITNQILGDDKDEDEIKNDVPEDKSKDTLKDEDADDNVFSSLSKELIKQGIFTPDEDEEGNPIEPTVATTPEEFRDNFLHEVKKQSSYTLQNFLSKFGEDRQELFNAIFVNGVDPQTYIPKFNELQDFSNIDLTEESNQEKVVRAYYKKANWSDESIDKKITKLKDLAYLDEEAQEVHPKLVEEYKADLNREQENKLAQQQEEGRRVEAFQRKVDTVLREALKTRDFEGFPVTEKSYKETLDYISTPKWKTKSGELLTEFDKAIIDIKNNPDDIKKVVLMGLIAKNGFDLSKVKKSAVGKESGELFNSLKKQQIIKKQPSTSGSNWLDKL